MPTSNWEQLVGEAASLILDAGAKGVLLVVAALLLAACLRRRSPALRHLLLTGAALGLLLLPVCRMLLPSVEITLAAAAPIVSPAPASAPPVPPVVSEPVARPELGAVSVPTQHNRAPENGGARARVAALIVLLWVVGAACRALSVAAAMLVASKRTRELPSWPEADLKALTRRVPEAAGVRVLRASSRSIPALAGIFGPTLLLPADALSWTPDKLRSVWLHEVAHMDRRDCLAHVAAIVASIFHWFSPPVYILLRQLRREREQACDDIVLSAGIRPSDYAGILVDIARGEGRALPSPAVLTMARAAGLERRVERLLAPDRSRGKHRRLSAVLLLALVPVATIPIGCLALHRSPPVSLEATVPPFLLPGSAAFCHLSFDFEGCSPPTKPLWGHRATVSIDGRRFTGAIKPPAAPHAPLHARLALGQLRDRRGRPPDLGLGAHALSVEMSSFRVRLPDGRRRTVRGLRSAPARFQIVDELPESALRPVRVANAADLLARWITATWAVGPLGKASVTLHFADDADLPFGFCHRVIVRRDADGAEAEAGTLLFPQAGHPRTRIVLAAYLPLPERNAGSGYSVRLVPHPALTAEDPQVTNYLAEEVVLPGRPGTLESFPVTIEAKFVEPDPHGDSVLSAPKVTTIPGNTAVIKMVEKGYLPEHWTKPEAASSRSPKVPAVLGLPQFRRPLGKDVGESGEVEVGITLEVTPELGEDCIVLSGRAISSDVVEPEAGDPRPPDGGHPSAPRIERTTVPYKVTFTSYGTSWRLPFKHNGRERILELRIY